MKNVANNNFEALQLLNVLITEVNTRYSNLAASKLASDDMGSLEPK